MTHIHSNHADWRIAQMGVRPENLGIFLEFADVYIPCRKGLTSISMSRCGILELEEAGYPVQLIDRIKNLVVVMKLDDDTVISVMPYERKRGRHHRRDMSRVRYRGHNKTVVRKSGGRR